LLYLTTYNYLGDSCRRDFIRPPLSSGNGYLRIFEKISKKSRKMKVITENEAPHSKLWGIYRN